MLYSVSVRSHGVFKVLEIEADEVIASPEGDLVMYDKKRVVLAVARGSWQTVEPKVSPGQEKQA